MISRFRDQYFFLSNFYPAYVHYEGVGYASVEHGFQAAKCLNPNDRNIFKGITAGEAKKSGRRVRLRNDWEQVKLSILEDLVRQKFSKPNMKVMLLATGSEELVEENDWGDKFYGKCRGVGLNHLGRILMKVREELRVG